MQRLVGNLWTPAGVAAALALVVWGVARATAPSPPEKPRPPTPTASTRPSTDLSVRVVDSEGRPLVGWTVFVDQSLGRWKRVESTDASGTARFDGVSRRLESVGVYREFQEAFGISSWQRVAVEVPPSGELTARIDGPATSRVTGRLIEPRDATVIVRRIGEPDELLVAHSNADGSFAIENLPAATIEIFAVDDDVGGLFGPYEVDGESALDVGTLIPPARRSFTIPLSEASAKTTSFGKVTLLAVDGNHLDYPELDEGALEAELVPLGGFLLIREQDAGVRFVRRDLTLTDPQAAVDFETIDTRLVRFSLAAPPGASVLPDVRACIETLVEGRWVAIVGFLAVEVQAQPDDTYAGVIELQPGRFRIQLEHRSDANPRWRAPPAEFEVPAAGAIEPVMIRATTR